MSKNIRGAAILLVTAIIWGFAFVAQSEGMDKIGALTFQAARMLLASLVLFQLPSLPGLAGCALMFTATVIAQLPEKKKQ